MFPALAHLGDQLVLWGEGWGAASSRRLTMPPKGQEEKTGDCAFRKAASFSPRLLCSVDAVITNPLYR